MPSYTFDQDGSQTVQIEIDDEFSVGVGGDFGGGTLAVKYACKGSTYTFASGTTGSFTAAGERVFRNCGDTKTITITLSGSTSPDLDVSVANNAYGA